MSILTVSFVFSFHAKLISYLEDVSPFSAFRTEEWSYINNKLSIN